MTLVEKTIAKKKVQQVHKGGYNDASEGRKNFDANPKGKKVLGVPPSTLSQQVMVFDQLLSLFALTCHGFTHSNHTYLQSELPSLPILMIESVAFVVF